MKDLLPITLPFFFLILFISQILVLPILKEELTEVEVKYRFKFILDEFESFFHIGKINKSLHV